jgi:hypothetical protein
MKTRRSLELTAPEWKRLERLAEETESHATGGPRTGQPSWRVFIAGIGAGEIEIKTRKSNRK